MEIELKCKHCQNQFITDYKHRDKQFCNRNCYFNYARENKLLGKEKDESIREIRNCLLCNKEFVERIKHKKTLCSDECRLVWSQIDENKQNRILKSKQSLLEKYGVESIFHTKEFKNNRSTIFNEIYGVTHPMYVPEFVDKLKQTIRDNHLLKLLPKLESEGLELLDPYLVNKNGVTSRPYQFKCTKCDTTFTSTLLGSGKIPICRKCKPITKNSNLEGIIRDFINKNKIKHIDNDRTILEGKEIDMYFPDYGIGIEVNGNYFHSEKSGEKQKYYHIDKSIISSKKKIKLIQIFEDELLLSEEKVFSRLSSIFSLNKKIFARNCEIRPVTKKTSTFFLNENHLQGNSIDKYRFGLFYKTELVALMTFGKKRKVLGNSSSSTSEYELVRYCNKLNYNIIGGFSKLLKYFIKNHKPTIIETFADIRWSGVDPELTVYHKNGFTFQHRTPPNYWYLNKQNYLHRHHRFSFRKDVLVKEGFDKNKTEWEIMQEKNYDRIWDCGSLKFVMECK